MKHGWLENPPTNWRFLDGNITELNGSNGGFFSKPCLIITGGVLKPPAKSKT
jgi:hypothetical protein